MICFSAADADSNRGSAGNRHGFSLIELLVAIFLVSVLLSLLVPAVQAAREAGRKAQCRNNLRQIGIACQDFHSTFGSFPGNGWGWAWVADPQRGTGERQPGGWIFQLLPHLDLAVFWNPPADNSSQGQRAFREQLCGQPVPTFKCATRSADQLSPASAAVTLRNVNPLNRISRTDYAINEGDFISNTNSGPVNLEEGDDRRFAWTDVSRVTGVSWLRRGAGISEILDGTSNTYLAGEKYVSVLGYRTLTDLGYDQPMFTGVDLDISRWTLHTPIQDQNLHSVRSFGSAHSHGCQMTFCDGSVRTIAYAIDANLHRTLGNRKDGEIDRLGE